MSNHKPDTDVKTDSPDPEIISLRTQLVAEGHTKQRLIRTDMMTVHLHSYGAGGGENGMHAHTQEDHAFVCLQGEALFRGINGVLPPLKKNQMIFLPKGCYYSFSIEGDQPCVLLRFGAGLAEYGSHRIDPKGEPIVGRATQKGHVEPVLIENAFFE